MKLTIANTAQVVQTVLEGSAELGLVEGEMRIISTQGSGRRRWVGAGCWSKSPFNHLLKHRVNQAPAYQNRPHPE